MSGLRLAFATVVARLAAFVLRVAGSGATTAPGRILLWLAPRAIRQRAERLKRGCVVISATNGKTTTSSIVAEIMRVDGAKLVHNRAGANMAGGIASTLIDQQGDFGLFEVDEFWLPALVNDLTPRALLLGNLFRDQLDRYGELDQIVERWRAVASSEAVGTVVLNADDPIVAGLGTGAKDPIYFGIEDQNVGTENAQHASEQACCPICGAQFAYSRYFVGHLGHYSCPNGHVRRPTPQISARGIELRGLSGSSFTLDFGTEQHTVDLVLPGLYNVYNAVAAAALATSLGVPTATIITGIAATRPVFGRAETLQVDGRDCSIMLIKNPAGANEVLRTLASDPGERDLLIVLNDQIADGRDISWIWDADFEQLAGSTGRVVCSGSRAVELALRLKYANVNEERVSVESDPGRALAIALATSERPLVVLPTYTAMLELRELLVSRGAATDSFA